MIKIEEKIMRVSCMGAQNPMPDIQNVGYIHAGFEVKPSLSEDERRYLGKGMIRTMLPYQMQDSYARDLTPTPVTVAVLENDYLRAEFLPQYGARLWSLYDKKAGRELLYTNTVIQPCNFALRNAWLAGGVEFNVGIKGHTPLTCSPMFCERCGEDTLRFYEYERIRGVAYSVTAYLPADARALYIRPCIENTSENEIFMYWWSNIAFPEVEKTRVIVPAHDAIHCLYQEDHYVVDKTSIPYHGKTDVTYPQNLLSSADYFYKIPPEEKKWIAAVNPDGTGLYHYSNARLIGRKLFLWGTKTGGRHWNEFLSEPGQAYIEIQAGLAHTQLEHIPMPPKTKWEWTEGYTALDGTEATLYGDWDNAIAAVQKQIESRMAEGALVSYEELPKLTPATDGTRVYDGSGFGALENRVRALCGGESISDLDFTCTPDGETAQWHQLLDCGALPCPDKAQAPTSYVSGAFWQARLAASAQSEAGKHWYTYLQLGVTCYANVDVEGAKEAWEQSLACENNLWANRNLGMLYKNEYKDISKGMAYLDAAFALPEAKACLPFLREYAAALTAQTEREGAWSAIYHSLCADLQQNARLRTYLAMDLFHLGELDAAKAILEDDFVLPDVKEGELSLSWLWRAIHAAKIQKEQGVEEAKAMQLSAEQYPLPYHLDFRMHD